MVRLKNLTDIISSNSSKRTMDSKRRKHTVGVTSYVHLQREALIKKNVFTQTQVLKLKPKIVHVLE